jgi:hypothetical protein
MGLKMKYKYKYTFKNGATVEADTVEQAYEVIKRDYGTFIPVIKREKIG